jgi:hypothetical protein
MGRLPEAWIAPPQVRELRELVRYRAKLVALHSGLKAQVHAVLAKAGMLIPASHYAVSRALPEVVLHVLLYAESDGSSLDLLPRPAAQGESDGPS